MRRSVAAALVLVAAGCASAGPRGPGAVERALRPHARAYEVLLAAEDARAASPAQLATLRQGLASTEPELRRLAVRALGRLEREDMVPDIVPLLADASPRVQAAAAHALGQAAHGRDGAGIRQHAAAALGAAADPMVVAALAETLGRSRHADAAQAAATLSLLRPLLERDNDDVRLGTLRGLYLLARQPAARGVFDGSTLQLLRFGAIGDGAWADPRARMLAIATVSAARGAPAAWLDFIITTDREPTVRREAVAAAAGIGDADAIHEPVTRALSDDAAMVRYEALRVYGRLLAERDGCEPVGAAMADDHFSLAVLAFDLAAGVCSRDANVRSVLARTVERGTDVRSARALAALATVDAGAARPHLARFTRAADPFVRMHAATAAGRIGDTQMLLLLAQDEHANVRTVAVGALSEAAGAAHDAVYIAQLERDESELLMAAAAALEGSTHSGAPAAMLDALDRVTALRMETSRDGRRALLTRVRELGSAELSGRVRPYLNDFDPAIAELAAATLHDWTGTRPEPAPRTLPAMPLPTFAEVAALERADVRLHMQDGGTIRVRLHAFDAPTNAARFARLADAGYYDGLTFHRVVPNFVVQGGSPHANEYSGDGPFTRDELGRSNWRGTIGLSTRGRDTGDAQFYINLIDNVRLDHEYTVFGAVVSGMDVVDALPEGAVIRRIEVRR